MTLTPEQRKIRRSETQKRYREANKEKLAAARKIEVPPRPCVVCGTVFQPTRSDAMYCSGGCRWRAFVSRHHPDAHLEDPPFGPK